MLNERALKAEMVKHGYTQESLSKEMGISSRTFYNKCKSGNFGTDEIEKMIDLLHLDAPMDIFFAKK